ncbi:STAS domain-containing protein [Streptomyces sp. NPDC058877]|uniref:STAS domain-containing protein n=1 Tax=Streptomyces sp. NPDC058877 TaxID=3346665 RepID=UPI0036BFD38D
MHLYTLSFPHPHHYVVSFHGEADILSAPLLRRALSKAVENAAGRDVVANLCEIDFMDSSGVAPLIEADMSLHSRGRRLWISCATARSARLFRALKLDGVFPKVPRSMAAGLCNNGPGHPTTRATG